jgi:hypothetical protein
VGDLIGSGAAQEQAIVGETPNLAARLQSLAEPGTLSIDANPRRLVGELFEFRDLGGIEAKGFPGAVPEWQVLRPSGVASRFDASRAASPTPLIGREEEIEFLLRRWRAKQGLGQVVLVLGRLGSANRDRCAVVCPQQSVLYQAVRADWELVGGEGRQGLIRGVTVPCRTQRQRLPPGLTCLVEAVNPCQRSRPHIANTVGRGQRRDMQQHAGGAIFRRKRGKNHPPTVVFILCFRLTRGSVGGG